MRGFRTSLSKYGRAATDERFIPDLVNMGLDLNTATHVAEAFYSTSDD